MNSFLHRVRFQIAGQVQGVGFRPFVYRLARELSLTGWVNNDSRGVNVEVQGLGETVETFARRLASELPPLAKIERCDRRKVEPVAGENTFAIVPSEEGELSDAQVTVDAAVCGDCLREMFDPADPRYGYAFINCTNCGPRYSIVRRVPYDRPNTTMEQFPMCPLCRGEYDDPRSRRFHAQPIACPRCGPKLRLTDPRGVAMDTADPVARTAELLAAGKIVAIKGLGGFHIACRADDEHVVRRLRSRKRRDAKPLAIMVCDLDRARDFAQINADAAELLTGPIRPVVLLPAVRPSRAAPAVAEGLTTIGVMLPYTPLHHLLFSRPELTAMPVVMTSGNFSEEPLIKDNDDAVAHLGLIADALLLHDRPIENRVDDSVVQMHTDHASVLRRARGYAPAPVALPERSGAKGEGRKNADISVLAVGPELKNTVCLLRGGRALLSEHIGDLKDGRAYRHFIETINHLEELFDVQPQVLAADLHPQYLSTEYALKRHRGELAGKPPLPIVRVQHHHAHIVACMTENGYSDPVIGLACDGVGLGDDGAVWGCEVLRAEPAGYQRLGHLRYTPLLGGDAAAKETARPALAALWDAVDGEIFDLPLAVRLAGGEEALQTASQMLQARLNCPPSSSLGRWFDAVAGLCGLADRNEFEGQAPMKLEGVIAPGVENHYDYRVTGEPMFQIDLRPMVREVVADISASFDVGVVAARFHNTVAAFLLDSARLARESTGLNVVALSGGCFANRYLSARLTKQLHAEGFELLLHHTVPVNDGCVALGQAVVATAQRQVR